MAYTLRNHRLQIDDTDVAFDKSPNGGAAMTPRYLIVHYTAGTTASGAVNWFNNPAAQASAHLVMDRDGSITQMMEFNRVAWHAGKSTWGEIVGLNYHSIGIEIVNAGKLQKTAGGHWVNWAGNKIDDDDVIIATHKHENAPTGWHAYSKAQVDATIGIGMLLKDKYGLLDVLGHEDISKGRKVDPGPAFPLISVQSKIMGRQD